jgi:hypothetical protein
MAFNIFEEVVPLILENSVRLLLGKEIEDQNQSLRYATHQHRQPIGTVAASAHQSGNATSANVPMTEKVIQKTLRCIL